MEERPTAYWVEGQAKGERRVATGRNKCKGGKRKGVPLSDATRCDVTATHVIVTRSGLFSVESCQQVYARASELRVRANNN